MIAVVADDITGAAEIAGIGFSYGLRVNLTRKLTEVMPDCDMLVVITNTRSADVADAVVESKRIGEILYAAGVEHIFKKCDSVLRGHVSAELRALVGVCGKSGALLLPANPSLGRKIIGGYYFIDSKPITQTNFANDPEFPAKSDKVVDLLGGGHYIPVGENTDFSDSCINIGDVESEDNLRDYCAKVSSDVLLAGGSSLFKAYLGQLGCYQRPIPKFSGFGKVGLLLLCGSTFMHDTMMLQLANNNIPIERMPQEVYAGLVEPETWIDNLVGEYSDNGCIAIAIDRSGAGFVPQYADRLKLTMAKAAERIVIGCGVSNLVVEGGATAYELICRMGWCDFHVVSQLSTGVITLRPDGDGIPLVTLKPGSYEWPDKVI